MLASIVKNCGFLIKPLASLITAIKAGSKVKRITTVLIVVILTYPCYKVSQTPNQFTTCLESIFDSFDDHIACLYHDKEKQNELL